MYNIRCIILDLDLTKAFIILDLDLTKAFITTEIKCTGCTRLYDCAILNTLTLDQGWGHYCIA